MGNIHFKGPKDNPKFYVRYIDTDGVRKNRRVRVPTRAAARRMLAEIEERVALGLEGIPKPSNEERAKKTVTIRELSEQFLTEYGPPRIKDIKVYRSQARCMFKVRILPTLGDKPAASVRTLDVERLRDRQLADGLSPGSVAQTLATLSKLYSWANKVGLLDCGNPVIGCERTKSGQSLDFLTREEIQQLLAHVEEHAPDLLAMVATAIYTGMRKGELFGLRWQDLALDRGRLDVMRSYRLLPKGGKPRYLPVNPELARILRQWRNACPATDEGLVFPVRAQTGAYRMGTKDDVLDLPKLLRDAKCHAPKKPWHALRHTFASHFMMSGGNILTLQKLLGHSDLKMTMIYAHLSPDFVGAEVAKMSFAAPEAAGIVSLEGHRRATVTG
jgi:integrase